MTTHIRLASLDDARFAITDWTTDYLEQPTDAQVHRAARALLRYVGGCAPLSKTLVREVENADTEISIAGFDLDGALYDA